MSIADKLLTVAENMPKVYEAGRKSATGIDESKIIEKTATGKELVCLNDVSEVPHNLSASVRSKNLYDESQFDATNDKSYAWCYVGDFPWTLTLFDRDISVDISGINFGIAKFSGFNTAVKAYSWFVEKGVVKHTTKNNYASNHADYINTRCDYLFIYPNSQENVDKIKERFAIMVTTGDGVSTAYAPYIEDFSNVTVSAQGKNLLYTTYEVGGIAGATGLNYNNTKQIRSDFIPLKEGKYCFSILDNNYKVSGLFYYDSDKVNVGIAPAITLNSVITTASNTAYCRLRIMRVDEAEMTEEDLIKVNSAFQLETGIYVTEYEIPKEPVTYPASADGTVYGVKSISPNMSLLSNTNGVNIDVTYHKSFGMQTEYDRFWYTFQANGNRTDYLYAFSNWTDEIYNPKYPIVNEIGNQAFYQTKITNTKVPITIRMVRCVTTFSNASSLITIPYLDVSGVTDSFDRCFNSCGALENLTIVGSINANGFNVQWSTNLTHDSLMSIINALKDYSEDTSGTTWTVTLGATNLAKLTTAEKEIATQKGWLLA